MGQNLSMDAKVWREWALCAAGASFWAAAAVAAPGDRAANVILFIGDGMGPEHVAAARCFKGAPLCFEEFPHFALVDTDSLGGLTDSSAAATAIATGSRVEWYTYGDRSGGRLPKQADAKCIGMMTRSAYGRSSSVRRRKVPQSIETWLPRLR